MSKLVSSERAMSTKALLVASGGVAVAVAIYYYMRVHRCRHNVASTTADIPTFDLSKFLAGEADEATCKAMAAYLRETSILVVRDPRVSASEAAAFTAQMQRYYAQPTEVLMKDARVWMRDLNRCTPRRRIF
jgi:hypothetical protein